MHHSAGIEPALNRFLNGSTAAVPVAPAINTLLLMFAFLARRDTSQVVFWSHPPYFLIFGRFSESCDLFSFGVSMPSLHPFPESLISFANRR
jgi:hypothetical protein